MARCTQRTGLVVRVALSAAERQRRSRAHKRGDHSACDPDHCDSVTTAVTPVTVTTATGTVTAIALIELGVRGRRLWAQVLAEHQTLGPRQRLILEEAARTADRLDYLDRILRGDESSWIQIRVPEVGTAELIVDKLLSEARQQQGALARLLSELRQSLAPPSAKPATSSQPSHSSGPAQASGGGTLGDLTSRIAQRRGATAG